MDEGIYLMEGREILTEKEYMQRKTAGLSGFQMKKEEAVKNTISYRILQEHNRGDDENLKLKFDILTSHDMTNVGIIQTARACGVEKFSLPVVLTNCQNTLCAIGGTINRDDHIFALNAAQTWHHGSGRGRRRTGKADFR